MSFFRVEVLKRCGSQTEVYTEFYCIVETLDLRLYFRRNIILLKKLVSDMITLFSLEYSTKTR